MNGSSVPPPPGSPQLPKKGLSPLAWVGIGCGVLLLIGLIAIGGMAVVGGMFVKKQVDKFEKNPAMAAAELVVRANPDLELVSSDSEKNTLTVRNTKTGETMTLNAEDIKEGRWSVTNEKGETVDFSTSREGLTVTNEKGETMTWGATAGGPKDLPSWVPSYPGGTVQGTMDSNTNEGRTMAFTMSTQDSLEEVLTFYENELKAEGFTVEKNTMSANDQATFGTVSGKAADGKREVGVMISVNPGQGTQAVVTVQDKK